MTLSDIFSTFTAGSLGFCMEVAAHTGINATYAEIERIALRSAKAGPNSDDMAAEFQRICAEETWWMDEQADVGKKARVNGWNRTGRVIRTMGRTVEVEFPYGIVSTDRSKVVIY